MCSAELFLVKIGQKTTVTLFGYVSCVICISAHISTVTVFIVYWSGKRFGQKVLKKTETHILYLVILSWVFFIIIIFEVMKGTGRIAYISELRLLNISAVVLNPFITRISKDILFAFDCPEKRRTLFFSPFALTLSLYIYISCTYVCCVIFCSVLNNKRETVILIVQLSVPTSCRWVPANHEYLHMNVLFVDSKGRVRPCLVYLP
jgi:hypothetical protein